MTRRVLAVALVLAAAACGGDDTAAPTTTGPPAGLVDALCQAREAATSGDPDRARTIFFDRAHDRLHELAAAVSDDDRAAEARLLEAKQRVEADLDNADPALAEDLDALAAATGDAIAASDDPRPAPCTP